MGKPPDDLKSRGLMRVNARPPRHKQPFVSCLPPFA
jgi:hypothetical protein